MTFGFSFYSFAGYYGEPAQRSGPVIDLAAGSPVERVGVPFDTWKRFLPVWKPP